MRILIISRDSWNNTNNTGNTLSNLFQEFTGAEFGNIFCRDEVPQNNCCKSYYRISERLLIKKLFNRNYVLGEKINKSYADQQNTLIVDLQNQASEKKRYDFFRKYRLVLFLWLRELLWKIVNWRSNQLNDYLDEFNPDIIFSPSYDSFYMHDILHYVKKRTDAKVVFFHYDDLLSYRQYSLSPLFWLNRYMLRQKMKKSINLAEINYCITREQIDVYEKITGKAFKLLQKAGNFNDSPVPPAAKSPLKIIYTGNVIYGRLNSLIKIGGLLNRLNHEGKKFELIIYSANAIPLSALDFFKKTQCVYFKGKISSEIIPTVLAQADLLLHVESFEKHQKLSTSLSFSTKLIDYFQAGRCCIAFGWEKAVSIKYIEDNGLGISASCASELSKKLLYLAESKETIVDIGKTVWRFGLHNHNRVSVLEKFKKELASILV